MPKNIKCSQCKHLQEFKEKTLGIAEEFLPISFRCEADRSNELNKNNIKQFRDCSLFKSRTETAYEEVKRDIIQKLKELLKNIKISIPFFK